ncbi:MULTISPECIES: hypothetical protein [unclassified Nocardioides]|uniref:hypothetical protein n=1 Tax=unclassified Nocardioides TaxID=2615069 RepID=UPI003615BC9B
MRLYAVALAALLVAGGMAPSAIGQSKGADPSADQSRAVPRVVRLEDARLKFEINSTDRDGGVQVLIDAEAWRTMSIFDPGGHRIFSTQTSGRLGRFGGSELFLESGEPPFAKLPLPRLLKQWPPGVYRFRGTGADGQVFRGSARLTHRLPDGPTLVSPVESSTPQAPSDTVMRWRPVPAPKGGRIIGYQVLVERETGLHALPVITLDVMMPPTAARLRVPPGFLRPNTEYSWEVLAIEGSGNQTLSSATFTTSH